MAGNRIARFFGDGKRKIEGIQSFGFNPFGPMMLPWQIELYQAAFLQAQRDVEESEEEDTGEWCI